MLRKIKEDQWKTTLCSYIRFLNIVKIVCNVNTTGWMNLKHILLSERSQTQTTYFMMPSIQSSRIGKTTVIESRSVVSWRWGRALTSKE